MAVKKSVRRAKKKSATTAEAPIVKFDVTITSTEEDALRTEDIDVLEAKLAAATTIVLPDRIVKNASVDVKRQPYA